MAAMTPETTDRGELSQRLIHERSIIELWSKPMTNHRSTYTLMIDRKPVAFLNLHNFAEPEISISSRNIAVYSNCDCFLYDRLSGRTLHQNMETPVRAAFYVGARWVILHELGVVLVDTEQCAVVAQCGTNDVILKYWWEGDDLLLVDFVSQRFRIKNAGTKSELNLMLE